MVAVAVSRRPMCCAVPVTVASRVLSSGWRGDGRSPDSEPNELLATRCDCALHAHASAEPKNFISVATPAVNPERSLCNQR